MQKILQQGAEAIILKENNIVVKKRIKKSYRLSVLDEKLRKLRTRSESKLLEKASKILNVPSVKRVDEKNKEIEMDFIDGKKLSTSLDNLKNKEDICHIIGEEVGKLHSNNLIHGDLTTSNLILSEEKVFFIDFGLGFHSTKVEDKAVDIHVFKEALEAKHYKYAESLWSSFLQGYESSPESHKILEQLKKVEARGRYRF
ncbi:MAG: KEOPS complex kinase/ATPase Bud32 [Nanoarchaeota archaeon]